MFFFRGVVVSKVGFVDISLRLETDFLKEQVKQALENKFSNRACLDMAEF